MGALRLAAMALATVVPAAVIAGCSGVSTTASTAQAPVTQQSTTAAAPTRHASSARPHRRRHPVPPQAELPVSRASSSVVQPQPAPDSCHARGSGFFSLPDPRCTPGAISPVVSRRTSSRRSAATATQTGAPAGVDHRAREGGEPRGVRRPRVRCMITSTTTSFRSSSAARPTIRATYGQNREPRPTRRTRSRTSSTRRCATGR